MNGLAHRWRRFTRPAVGICLLTVCVSWLGWRLYRARVGEPSAQLNDNWYTGHRILAADGSVLRELPAELGRRGRSLPFEQLGTRIVQATLAAEDARFHDHDGVDRLAIARAMAQNVHHAQVISGASTITQQLVKLLDTRGVTGPRTLLIKLREAARAQNLESRLDKQAILQSYLHRLPYGHGLIGPEAAARGYFGVHARDLSWAQATFLAVVPRAPTFLDPIRYPQRVVSRQRAVLDQLLDDDVIDPDTHARANAEFLEVRRIERPFVAPHFTQMLIDEARLQGGSYTQTTLDPQLQHDVEGLVRTHLASMRDHAVDNAAVVVVDNSTASVRAWVGSADFFGRAGQVDLVRARRQPGSTLKPFVYQLAFSRGLAPTAMLADVPTRFDEGGGSYTPHNFDHQWSGPVAARDALAASLNVPVIRVAATFAPNELLGHLHALGFASLKQPAEHYGLALALGSGEVSLRELAAAYVTLARGGEVVALRVTERDPTPTGASPFNTAATAAVVDALADPSSRTKLLRSRSPFNLGYPVALKTGTSSGFRDAWTAGFTHEFTVVVWLGNSDGSPMRAVTGASGAGPLFADVLRRAMQSVHTRGALIEPGVLAQTRVCPLSGMAPTLACPHAVTTKLPPEQLPLASCQVHQHRESAAFESTALLEPAEVVACLPEPFDSWLQTLAEGAPGYDPFGVPWVRIADAPACTAQTTQSPALRMEQPRDGSVVHIDPFTTDGHILLRASWDGSAHNRPREVEYVVDGDVVGRSAFPYELLARLGPGDHSVYARPVSAKPGATWRSVRFAVNR